jgi:hypothetical protein
MLAVGMRTSSKNSSDVSLDLEPHLVEVAAAPEAFDLVGLDHHQRGALGSLRRVGLGHDDDQIGVLAIGDEGLRAVDDIVIAVLLGDRLDALQVGAGARFGHRDGADHLARRHFGQPFLFLLFRAEMQDVGRDDGIVQRDAEPVRACAAERFR